MKELKKIISGEKTYKADLFYKLKVFFLLKYYRLRRIVVDILTLILSERQKFIIKKFLNKYFNQNYNLFLDEVIEIK